MFTLLMHFPTTYAKIAKRLAKDTNIISVTLKYINPILYENVSKAHNETK